MATRVISLIPSITETLIEAGANVVGRSRFCIQPKESIENIPAVGGTKDIDWEQLRALKPDLIILDREENTREMAESCPFPFHALHITNVLHMAPELSRLSQAIDCPPLQVMAERWEAIATKKIKLDRLESLPGMVEWWKPPTQQSRLEYLIWRKPWMAIGPDTFIHSMLCQLGASNYLLPHTEKYPTINLEALNPEETVLLFSTEPYLFAKEKDELMKLGFSCGLIDAECLSWYGVRSLRFLESIL